MLELIPLKHSPKHNGKNNAFIGNTVSISDEEKMPDESEVTAEKPKRKQSLENGAILNGSLESIKKGILFSLNEAYQLAYQIVRRRKKSDNHQVMIFEKYNYLRFQCVIQSSFLYFQ